LVGTAPGAGGALRFEDEVEVDHGGGRWEYAHGAAEVGERGGGEILHCVQDDASGRRADLAEGSRPARAALRFEDDDEDLPPNPPP
jgi:hypothetical protein